eukprot:Hpha_TRINITY_DN10802_c0_g1::TRINITY_DN10802_c0_g1_i1::g.23267::m.23267
MAGILSEPPEPDVRLAPPENQAHFDPQAEVRDGGGLPDPFPASATQQHQKGSDPLGIDFDFDLDTLHTTGNGGDRVRSGFPALVDEPSPPNEEEEEIVGTSKLLQWLTTQHDDTGTPPAYEPQVPSFQPRLADNGLNVNAKAFVPQRPRCTWKGTRGTLRLQWPSGTRPASLWALGLAFEGRSLKLKGVMPGSPAEDCEAQQCIGCTLCGIGGVPVSDAADLTAASLRLANTKRHRITLRFTKIPSRQRLGLSRIELLWPQPPPDDAGPSSGSDESSDDVPVPQPELRPAIRKVARPAAPAPAAQRVQKGSVVSPSGPAAVAVAPKTAKAQPVASPPTSPVLHATAITATAAPVTEHAAIATVTATVVPASAMTLPAVPATVVAASVAPVAPVAPPLMVAGWPAAQFISATPMAKAAVAAPGQPVEGAAVASAGAVTPAAAAATPVMGTPLASALSLTKSLRDVCSSASIRFTALGGQGGGGAVFSADAVGKENSDEAEEPLPMWMDPRCIRFSQKQISPTFANGKQRGEPLMQAVQQLRECAITARAFPCINVFRWPEGAEGGSDEFTRSAGCVFTCDNRRLWVFREAKVQMVPVRWIAISAVDPAKLSTENGGVSVEVGARTPRELSLDAQRRRGTRFDGTTPGLQLRLVKKSAPGSTSAAAITAALIITVCGAVDPPRRK